VLAVVSLVQQVLKRMLIKLLVSSVLLANSPQLVHNVKSVLQANSLQTQEPPLVLLVLVVTKPTLIKPSVLLVVLVDILLMMVNAKTVPSLPIPLMLLLVLAVLVVLVLK